ncbi:MAG: DNA primase [Gammaproteobacteria bacterium]|nr:DNA primase [Gammaproteobacteria bacterium]MCW5582431.1 DNA primase [Gammaproteobacteria bacterium]
MSIPREFIELLLARIDLVDLINTQIPLRKKSGSNYFARCPFHNEKSASFSVSQPKQFYYCFGCGAHGNAIDFMMQHERLSFPEAIETLAKQAGVEVPRSAAIVKKDDSLPAMFDLMTEVAQYFYEQMRKSQRAINYLKDRGISGKIAKQFSLGYAPSGWNHLLEQFGKSEANKKRLLDTGLIIQKNNDTSHPSQVENNSNCYDRFRDRIMFPIQDYRGRIIGFGGRVIDQGEPKYLNSPETLLFQKGHELYGLYQALKMNRKLDKVLVVEGYMDVVALFQHDITYAVATLGTATTSHHLHKLVRYTSEIIFCFDGDEAGRTAAWRALQVLFPLMQDNLQIRFLFLPDGEDPDSLVRKESKLIFEKRLSSALSLSAFFFQTLSHQCDLTTMEGRARFAASALNYIKQVPYGILSEILLEELAKRARIDINELKQQVKKAESSTLTPMTVTNIQPDITKPKLKLPMQTILALLVQNPSLANLITDPILESNLLGHAFLQRLIVLIKHNPSINTGGLIEHWRNQKEEKFVTSLACWEHSIPESGISSEFLGAIRQLNLLGIDEEINRLLTKASQDGLAEEEKQALSDWILKKKAVKI